MEIKVYCPCGAKYQFDVQPVNGRMPTAIQCPVCGADGTEQANSLIQQKLQQEASAPAIAPANAAPPAKPSLRVSQAPPSHAAPVPPLMPVVDPQQRQRTYTPPPKSSAAGNVKNILKTVLAVLIIGITCLGFGWKWYRRIRGVVNSVEAINGSDSVGADYKWTLPDDDGVMMIVRHTNEMQVAQACSDFWREQMRTNYAISTITANDEVSDDARYFVQPAYNGNVRIDGPIMWDEQETNFTRMSEYVSQKLDTMVVEALIGDDAEGGLFMVFDKGERKFRLERTLMFANNDIKEIVNVEGDAWANSTGFKPSTNGYAHFTIEDANDLTHHLGFKLYDMPEPASCLVLKDKGPINAAATNTRKKTR